MGSSPNPHPKARKRLALGSSRRRIGYERRIRVWVAVLTLPSVVCTSLFVFGQTASLTLALASAAALAFVFLVAATYFFDQLIRPLQTLANVVAALREDDFSFRARGARRGDALGDLALEINALAGTLQTQRASARDALTLAERVMTSMQSPVLAFDVGGALRLLNPAAEIAFHLTRRLALGRAAADLGIEDLLQIPDEELYSTPSGPFRQASRYSVRRTTFRLHGVPHTLLVLSDVAAALREEERVAWQRLIRVLSHEINNSLTPIKSLAGSLRTRLDTLNPADLHRGLTVIEERAASLNRFLQAYQQLTRLPAPAPKTLRLRPLLEQAAHLETRLPVLLHPGPAGSPDAQIFADPDQLQQLLINLIRNGVEAALAGNEAEPQVAVSWTVTPSTVAIQIRDNGPGLLDPANLFVPFYTTKPEGSGIGLVLAQQIASAHRGSVTLTNRSDRPGCIAELRLPAQSS
jgi:nitrogen fixation/metabolism regulation signal transduction histidine kinase